MAIRLLEYMFFQANYKTERHVAFSREQVLRLLTTGSGTGGGMNGLLRSCSSEKGLFGFPRHARNRIKSGF